MDRLPQADVAIITVTHDQELSALLCAFDIPLDTQPTARRKGLAYWYTTLTSRLTRRNLQVVIVPTGKPGNPRASAVATEVAHQCRPRLLILTGIAAGLRGKTNLVDVIAAQTVLGYEPARLTPEGSKIRLEPHVPIDRILNEVSYFNSKAIHRGWHARFREGLRNTPPDLLPQDAFRLDPRAHLGILASGEKLIADGSLHELSQHHEKLLGADMESAGFADAAGLQEIPWIIIRGVSDHGDPETKDGPSKDRFHYVAALSAAAYVRTMLEWVCLAELDGDVSEETPGPPSPPGSSGQILGRDRSLRSSASTPDTFEQARKTIEHVGLERGGSAICFDLDALGNLNARRSLDAGDFVLEEVRRLGRRVAETGYFFELGRDEFSLFLPGASLRDAILASEKIAAGLRAIGLSEALGREPISASMGIATFPNHVSDPSRLLESARNGSLAGKYSINRPKQNGITRIAIPVSMDPSARPEAFAVFQDRVDVSVQSSPRGGS